MKKNIFISLAMLFSFSTSFAAWTDMVFDFSRLHMTIVSGQVSYTPNGLDFSRAPVSVFVPVASAKWNGTAYNYLQIAEGSFKNSDGKLQGIDDLICKKIGRDHASGSSETKSVGGFESIAILNSDLKVKTIDPASGTRVYDVIECL